MTTAGPAASPLVLVSADPVTRAAAEAALTPAERATYDGQRFEKRRRDWVLGRYASKLAACAAVDGAWTPDQVGVAPGPQGRPLLVAPDDRLAGWDLTLTHGHGHAAAIVAPGDVGVDLEKLRGLPENGWRFYLGEEERAWLAGQPLGEAGEIIVWALKEAAFKALHGEVDVMPKLRAEVAPGEEWARLTWRGGTLAARWQVGHGYAIAIATPAPAPAWFGAIALTLPPPDPVL